MGFIARLLGRQQEGAHLAARVAPQPAGAKRQQPSSPVSGSFAQEFSGGRAGPAQAVKLHAAAAPAADPDSDDEETIRVPGSLSAERPTRNSSLGRRRAAIDISPAAVKRLAERVAVLEAGQLRASLDGDSDGITHTELEALYTDLQLIHRGRASLVYRAREVRSGQRVILKAYDAGRLNPTRRANLDRSLRALRAAGALLGPSGGVVLLERVVQNPGGTYLVMQACNGGTLIEAIANSGGRLPERQVAVKVAAPLLRALAGLHGAGIVHRDLKPEHLLIHNGALRIGDFGSAACSRGVPPAAQHVAAQLEAAADAACHHQQQQQQQQQDGAAKDAAKPGSPRAVSVTVAACGSSSCSDSVSPSGAGLRDAMNFRTGSIEYMAPEMLDKPTAAEVFHLVIAQGIDEDDLPAYDARVDIWSLGVVLYEALTGLQPFLADSAADMAAVIAGKVGAGQQAAAQQAAQQAQQAPALPAFIERLQVSPEAKQFLAACLTWDPASRPGAVQLLHHPWLQAMQEQAAQVAASRASSRRSLQQQRGTPPLSPVQAASGAVPGAAAAATAAAAAADSSDGGGSGGLVDPLLSSSLLDVGLRDDGAGSTLERCHTTAQLEVGLRTVLRTNTQRLEPKASLPRVHAP